VLGVELRERPVEHGRGIRAALPHHEQRIALGIDQVDAQPAKPLQLRALHCAPELVLVGLRPTGQPFSYGVGDSFRVRIQPSQGGIVELVLEGGPLRLVPRGVAARQSEPSRKQAIAMAARNGRISFFGGLPKTNPTITCDSNLVHYRQLHIHGANGSAPSHNKRALSYIASGLVPVKDLITVHLPLDRALEAFDIVAKGQAIKVTVEP